MYKLYSVGDRTEPCGTPACMYLGVDISPSTETLNFLCERNTLISLIKKKELNGLGLRANYADRATAACHRSVCQLMRIEVLRGQRDGSLWPYFRFSRQEPLLFYQVAPQLGNYRVA
jgi:hypothetical protein